MLPYAFAIFSGAFLLFQVQPLIGKYILPWFGGGPGVWTTCLLFFQLLLLGGYAYAHVSTSRLRPRIQGYLHIGLLLASAALLPIGPGDTWKAHVAGNPTVHILLLLTATIGVPYFVLSATGPLLQRWFTSAYPGVSPYRLYALSNVGSLLALLTYPTYFEVKFTRHFQSVLWSAAFVVFALACAYCAWRHARQPAEEPSAAVPNAEDQLNEALARPTPTDRLLWVVLPATASVLLLATTNKLCQEIAVIPFLWVMPLGFYLLSFVICFDHARWYRRSLVVALLAIAVAGIFELVPAGTSAPIGLQIGWYSAALFCACLFCHGELYQLRPAPRYLTSFYLFIALGGAIGGVLVAIVAPVLFTDFHEFSIGWWALTYLAGVMAFRQRSLALVYGCGIGLVLVTFALPLLRSHFKDGLTFGDEWLFLYKYYGWFVLGAAAIFLGCVLDARTRTLTRAWQPRAGGFVMMLTVLVGLLVVVQWRKSMGADVIDASRNFYGTLKVYDYYADIPEERYLLLLHGATTHGVQFVADDKAMRHTTYYGETSGIGRAIAHAPRPAGQRRIGLVGLGTGTVASYGTPGDYLRIYDINPAVVQLAKNRFTYLRRCPAKVDIVLGDARLSLEHELAAGESQRFDVLALDAFSSDAIPVHLLTKEAFAVYWKHLTPDGILAVHTSNRYLDLRPVVERLAAEFGFTAITISDEEHESWVYPTTWILVTKNPQIIDNPEIVEVGDPAVGEAATKPLWTDDYASVFRVLRHRHTD
jgi:hypothetical protein